MKTKSAAEMKTKSVGLRECLLVSMFAALTAASAFVRIPTGISSFTLQDMMPIFAGIMLGAKAGALSQLIYVALGLLGVPIFTAGGGIGYIFQPTFGFILALPLTAWVVGTIWRPGDGRIRAAIAGLAGLAALYAVGLTYMGFILNVHMGRGMSAAAVIYNGMLLFLPFDALKLAAAALTAPRLEKLLRVK